MAFPVVRTLLWLRWARRTGGLFAAAFTASIANGVLLVALQFQCDHLGGDAKEIGLLGGIIQITYLFGCLVTGPQVGRFNLKYVAAAGLGCLSLTALGMSLAPNLAIFLSIAGLHGLVTCLLWPPVMGWLSAGAEGADLSKRLGMYNLSWSSGLVIGPSVGGFLYEHGAAFPVAVGGMVTALIFILAMHSPEQVGEGDAEEAEPGEPPSPPDPERRRDEAFLILGRTANLFAYLGSGVLRYQMLPLAQTLEVDKPTFGNIMTGMSLTLAIAFACVGRAAWWHHRFGPLIASQAIIACAIAGLYFASETWHLAAAVVVGGACMSLTYSSSIYYSAAGGKRREASLAVHEVVLSVGFIIGAVGGGLLSEWIDLRLTYVAAALFMAGGMALQFVLRARLGSAIAGANNPAIHELVQPTPPVHNQPARKAG